MGEKHPSGNRLVNSQKCVRTGDIDEVGDDTHLTFFEMLGNWSLGDYFKDDAINWSFEFLTSDEWLGLPVESLAVSVFAGDGDSLRDEESAGIWKDLGISEKHIAYLGKEDNWWPAGGKHTGPQGPDTEMFYWTGKGKAPASFDPEDDQWVEIWNDVFMQYEKKADGSLVPLKQKNVDTGMGLERAAAVLQGRKNVYDTELFTPIISAIETMSGKKYGRDEAEAKGIRIIADHLRAATFMLGDQQGIAPSNVDQGYILRRLIRRAIRHGRQLGILENMTVPIAEVIIGEYQNVYSELQSRRELIVNELAGEEKKFRKTLEKGLKEFQKIFDKEDKISGQDAFVLYSTFGFPLEVTQELAEEQGQKVDKAVFEEEFKKHQELSRSGAKQKFAGGLADSSEETKRLHTATHLLHQALRQVLGEHVYQKGSNITSERLRFDFSHPEKMTSEQKKEVEDIVNGVIDKKLPVHQEMLTVEEAKAKGAIGLFEDKYAELGDKIKVYSVGDFSTEICGGPHVDNSGELGHFRIKKEEASSSGVRRIKAVLE